MPTLIRVRDGVFTDVPDAFVTLDDEAPAPASQGLIVSLTRFQTDGEALLDGGRALGVRLEPDQPVESLAYDLHRLALVAPCFPKFRDGRSLTAATLLRERLGFTGEVRAVGQVLREQAFFMVRCGFDSFAPADGSTAADWARAAGRFHHVYQAGADHRPPAFLERERAPRIAASPRED